MAQRYGTIAAHTVHRASVLVVYVVFCVHAYSLAGLIRRTPPPTFSDTAITDRHSDTTISQLRAHWVRISWPRENRSDMCPAGSRTLDFLRARRAPYPLGQSRRIVFFFTQKCVMYIFRKIIIPTYRIDQNFLIKRGKMLFKTFD